MESEARKLGKLENWNSLLGSSSSLELMRRARFEGRMMKGPGMMCVCVCEEKVRGTRGDGKRWKFKKCSNYMPGAWEQCE